MSGFVITNHFRGLTYECRQLSDCLLNIIKSAIRIGSTGRRNCDKPVHIVAGGKTTLRRSRAILDENTCRRKSYSNRLISRQNRLVDLIDIYLKVVGH